MVMLFYRCAALLDFEKILSLDGKESIYGASIYGVPYKDLLASASHPLHAWKANDNLVAPDMHRAADHQKFSSVNLLLVLFLFPILLS